MELNKLYKKLIKEREKYIIKKYDFKENSLFLMGLCINELYDCDSNVLDIKLTIHIQEESHGSLFTQPKIYINYKHNNLKYWIEKDFFGLDHFYTESNLNLILIDKDQEHADYIKLPQKTLEYCIYLADIIDNYEWDHFVNIGAFERAEKNNRSVWSSIALPNTNEKIWTGDLSHANWLETLSIIATQKKEEYQEKMLTLLSQHNKENLENRLEENLYNDKIIKRAKI